MAYYEMPVSLTPGQESGSQTINIPFSASYVSVQNQTPATVQFATGQRQTPLLSGITIASNKSYSGQMESTQTVTVYWTDANPMSTNANEIIFGFSDHPIQLSVSESGPVTNVNITNQVSGNMQVTGGTMDVNLQGVPTFNLAAGTNVGINGGTIDINSGNVNVTNPVQTNSLVKLGTTQFNVVDLGNGQSQSLLIAGITTGYFQTLVLEGTSLGGYTYTAAATAYNRNTSIGAATLTQSNGPNGEFYASGNLSAKQSFGNVMVGVTAQTTAAATIFNDNMQTGTNWATRSGAVTYGATGATLGANGTLITETQTPQLAPQNLTVQASATVANTSTQNVVNGANVGQTLYVDGNATFGPNNSSVLLAQNTYGATSFVPNANTIANSIGFYGSAYGTFTLYLLNNSGTVLAQGNITLSGAPAAYNYVGIPWTNLVGGQTYWVCVVSPSGTLSCPSTTTPSPVTINGITYTAGTRVNQSTVSASSAVTAPQTTTGSTTLLISVGVGHYSPFDTSGNCRPVVLTNGWIVEASYDVSAWNIVFKVSKDNGKTWSQLCWANIGSCQGNYVIASKGTTVFCHAVQQGNYTATNFYRFDATTVSNSALSVVSNPVTGQQAFGQGCDLFVDNSGTLISALTAKNSTYSQSANVLYVYSTDNGTTWAGYAQISNLNTANYNFSTPIVGLMPSGYPMIVAIYNANGTYYVTGWTCPNGVWNVGSGNTIYNGGTYVQANPTMCKGQNGTTVLAWKGCDSSSTSNPYIKSAKSTDGGATWTTPVNVSISGFNPPSITVDPSNKFYIVGQYAGDNHLYLYTSIDGAAWSGATQIGLADNCPNPQTAYPTTLSFSMPLIVYMDYTTNTTSFMGTWMIGSHTMLGVEYWKDSQNYYLLQWLAGNLNLVKVVAGVQTTITSATANETSTTVTLKLVVASNGNLTGTLSGANQNTITGNDTSITLGSLGITGDNGVIVTNGFISGNYIPSDTVTVDVYAI